MELKENSGGAEGPESVISKRYFSASRVAFYDVALRSAYDQAGSWPEDAKPIDDVLYRSFAAVDAPAGCRLGVGPDGMPVWMPNE
ncbi:hypothetical protein MyNCGM121_41470 [Achromobacter xylosoxidans]